MQRTSAVLPAQRNIPSAFKQMQHENALFLWLFSFIRHIWLSAEELWLLEQKYHVCQIVTLRWIFMLYANTCLQNKNCTTEVLPQHRSCLISRKKKNRRHFLFTVQTGNISRRKRKSFHANKKMSLVSGPKIAPQKQPKKTTPHRTFFEFKTK